MPREQDLFLPVRMYFEQCGYSCDGEVGQIDLYMEKDGQSVGVELKKSLDYRAVQQAALRQKVTDSVFIAIFRPKDLYSRSFRDRLYLLQRLGIGLLAVSERTSAVELISEPEVRELAAYRKTNRKKKEKLHSEFLRRTTRTNTGGVCGKKLLTAYREEALLVLRALLQLGGESTVREIRKTSGIPKTGAILYDNHYGWFDRPSKGLYRLTPLGIAAKEEYEEALEALSERYPVPHQ